VSPFDLFMVSVVIVTYNSESVISDCLKSVVNDLGNMDAGIIIVDNNSQDKTIHKIEQFSASLTKFSVEIKLIRNVRNEGFTKALNQGLSRVSYKYVLILNPDVIILKGFFREFISQFESDADVGIGAPQHLDEKGAVVPSCRNFPRYRTLFFEFLLLSYLFKKSSIFNEWKMGYFDHKSIKNVQQPMGACLFTSAEILEKTGLFDERFKMFFSDVDWCYRVDKAGYKIVFNPDAKIVHLGGHSIHQKRYRMIIQSHHDFYLYYKKYFNNPFMTSFVWLLLKITIPARFFIVFIKRLFK